MLRQLDRLLPPSVHYVVPEGGLYIWLTLPDASDVDCILKESLEQKVSFVEGKAFYPHGEKNNEIRLNFSNMQDGETIRGIEILAEIIRNYV